MGIKRYIIVTLIYMLAIGLYVYSFNGESLILAATNHEQLLDPGLWRRFDDIVHFQLPNQDEREELFYHYFLLLGQSGSKKVNISTLF